MRWLVIAFAVCVAILAACNQPDSNPHDVISLAIDTAPAPSIVAGDTMRIGDSTALGQLHAVAYNVKKDSLAVPITWLTLDPLVVTTDTFGHVYAGTDSIPATSRVVAEAGGLQSLPFNIQVIPRPDSVARDTSDSVQNLNFCKTLPVSSGFNADLWHTSDTAGAPVAVGSYLMHWAIISPASLAGKQKGTIADTGLIAYVADLSGNPSILDTTKSGVSTRVLIFGASALAKHDTMFAVTVQATARYQGRQLHNPVQITITFINPKSC